MASNFQDDEREQAMRMLFDLYKDESEGRSGVDAYLDLDGMTIPFELKTTSRGSVTTVRDFGPDHIEKWRDRHWLIGFFMQGREYYKYGSPAMMAPWIAEKGKYIEPDFSLAQLAPPKLNLQDMYNILGEKERYTYEDARYIQKRQYSKATYLARQDLDAGYSPQRMLEIVRDRTAYLIKRGSTLNNPHIPLSYFKNWAEITENHALILRQMVKAYLENE